MDQVYLLYSCDAWHSHSSKQVLGVFAERELLDRYILAMRKREKLSEYDLEMLNWSDQTQGRETNYLITTEIFNPN